MRYCEECGGEVIIIEEHYRVKEYYWHLECFDRKEYEEERRVRESSQ